LADPTPYGHADCQRDEPNNVAAAKSEHAFLLHLGVGAGSPGKPAAPHSSICWGQAAAQRLGIFPIRSFHTICATCLARHRCLRLCEMEAADQGALILSSGGHSARPRASVAAVVIALDDISAVIL